MTFGSTQGTSVQVVSDSEIKVLSPALPAGRYPITVSSGGQAMSGNPTFVVVAPPAFPYAAIPLNSSNLNGLPEGRLIYDAERQAIYVLDNSEFSPMQDSLERFRYVSGSWVTDPPINFPLPSPSQGGFDTYSAMALTPDGRELVKSNLQTVSIIDLATWQITATADATSAVSSDVDLLTGAMSNDGGFIDLASIGSGEVDAVLRYDSVANAFNVIAAPADLPSVDLSYIAASSPQGEQVAFYSGAVTSPQANIITYDAGTSSISESNPPYSGIDFASYSRDGTRTVLQLEHFYAAVIFSETIGGVPAGTYGLFNMDAAVMSPDGTRVYRYDAATGTIHTLDVSTLDADGTFVEIGSPVQIPDSPGTDPTMVITPDGGNLILAGTTHLIIIPTP